MSKLKIKKIYHIADIHLRLYKRHKEYRQVFKRLFEYINSTKDENSCIVLAGDIVHNKIDMSPELISITSDFLKQCADTLPTILILGNHDMNVNNLNRLDALTPIVTSLNHPNLQFWKKSGCYKFGDIKWSVFNFWEPQETWPKPSSGFNIALFHGPVMNSKLETSSMTTGIDVKVFDGFDLTLLGDIHTRQFLNDEQTIAYPGSLIQQNYGESISNHGIMVWDVKKKSGQFVDIENEYGFFTFDVTSGQYSIQDNLPKNLRIRLKYENTPNSRLEDILLKIGKRYNIIELVKQRINVNAVAIQKSDDLLNNSRDIDFQNKIISDLLSQNSDINKDEISAVIALNAEINKLLPINKLSRNSIWKPIKLEFSNMFSYGEGNVVDFSNFSGNYGIFNQNAQGKSALFDILSFVIYDKSTRASKSSHILNNTKDKFHCKFEFLINEQIFFIERVGTKNDRTGNVKVDVNFWTINESGETVNLNGEDRDKTNFAIRNYLGSYDDFIMTSLSTQYDNQNFVEKSQRDRKELLYKFLDIFIYDELYKLGKENSKELQVLIREFEKEDLHQKISQVNTTILEKTNEFRLVDERFTKLNSELEALQSQLVDLHKQFIPIENNHNIETIETDITNTNIELKKCVEDLKLADSTITNYESEQVLLQEQITRYEPYSEYQKFNTAYEISNKQVSECKVKIQQLRKDLNICKEKEIMLCSHEYDPNCKYCISNPFVQEAQQAISTIPTLEQQIQELEISLIELTQRFEIDSEYLGFAHEYNNVFSKFNSFKRTINMEEEKRKNIKYRGKILNDKLRSLLKQKTEYERNKLQIEKNQEIESNIKTTELQKKKIESLIQLCNKEHRNLELNIKQLKIQYDEYTVKLQKYLDYLKKYRIYELYLQTVSRDGVPYKIVEMVLPLLEYEVNSILNSISNFTIKLEASDEKYIHAFIQYGNNQTWPIELSCGMERFILSIAFRVALSEITSLPKSNFLAIDEGFGVLDSENILQIGKLFEYLRNRYDFLICISHIDTMRDLVDKHIKIDKVNGYSRIIHESN